MAKEYAHDPHCNTAHEAGPEPCPPAGEMSDYECGVPFPKPGMVTLVASKGNTWAMLDVTRNVLVQGGESLLALIDDALAGGDHG